MRRPSAAVTFHAGAENRQQASSYTELERNRTSAAWVGALLKHYQERNTTLVVLFDDVPTIVTDDSD